MKAIMVMFDSLNRHMLPPYGCDWVHAPNFKRLAERTVTFDRAYVASMPCMPARRELHTGRYNFLHRSWGPLEPFDDSMPELLKKNGVYTHLVTDHQHYWEDGGATYHDRYSSFEFMRGQEGDPWKGRMQEPDRPAAYVGKITTRDWINRSYMPEEEQMPQAQTFSAGLDFIRTNHQEDRWFLQLETFDPHEPFFAPKRFQDLYPSTYDGHFDWPPYSRVTETPEQVQHCRNRYAALVSMCDHYLGKVLDLMDELDLWKDTLLIVNTDHGFLLGEHDWWAKLVQPFYNEIAHMPLFIWDPRSGRRGERSQSLVQTIDLPPTLLEFFGVEAPPDMQGICLRDVLAGRADTRAAVLFGVHGGHVNCTDGRHVYMRAPLNSASQPLHEYTLMPTHMRSRFSTEELSTVELSEPFSFTKGCKLLKIPARPWAGRDFHEFGNLLFNVEDDPQQQNPLQDPAVEQRMIGLMKQLMETNDAPPEQYARLGI